MEWAWFTLDLLDGIEALHRVHLDHSMTNEPMVEGTQGTVASSARGNTEMIKGSEKLCNRFCRNLRQISRHRLDEQVQIMCIRFNGIDRDSSLTETGNEDLYGISEKWWLVRHGIFLLCLMLSTI
jgi:hypothetical protein